jgi:small subunit ribosomal protein S18
MARRAKSRSSSRRKSRDDSGVKKRSRHLDGVKSIDINDHDFLRKFVTEHGKIIPSRLTGATAKQQRRIKRGVRRARVIGVIA